MYVVIDYQKGVIESTFALLVVSVINVNISFVGLIVLSSIILIGSTVAWKGHEDVDPFKMLRIWIGKSLRLYIFG